MRLTSELMAKSILETYQHEVSRNGHRKQNVMNCAIFHVQEIRRWLDANACSKSELKYWDEVMDHVKKYCS